MAKHKAREMALKIALVSEEVDEIDAQSGRRADSPAQLSRN